jgi:hypothetical protein
VPRWSSQEASAARWLQPCQVVLSAAAGGCCEAVSVVGYEGGCSGRGVGGASVAVLRCRHLARHGSGRALGQYTQADLSTARHHRHPRRDTPLKETALVSLVRRSNSVALATGAMGRRPLPAGDVARWTMLPMNVQVEGATTHSPPWTIKPSRSSDR